AAACSSKLNERQNRFRSANPHARLIRLPKGACKTSCIPPDSSKKRSIIRVRCEGIAPNERYASAKYAVICSAAVCGNPVSLNSKSATALVGSPRCAVRSSQRGDPTKICSNSLPKSETARESSLVRAGASPSQNGIPGG